MPAIAAPVVPGALGVTPWVVGTRNRRVGSGRMPAALVRAVLGLFGLGSGRGGPVGTGGKPLAATAGTGVAGSLAPSFSKVSVMTVPALLTFTLPAPSLISITSMSPSLCPSVKINEFSFP